MASALQSLYKRHTRPSDLVPVELFNGIVKTLNSALSDDFTAEYPDLCEMIRENNEVFAAFKVHDQCKRMAKLLLDEEGNLKSFEQWSKEAEPISNHHNKVWLRTEYDTAIKRAEQARQWKQFESERDVLPNLRWVPSTAATPGADHMIFWDTVRPVDDPFWSQHKPGDRWGCQCSLEATDDPETDIPAGSEMDEPAPGLDNNPAKDGKLFSDSHPYFPSSCSTCPFNSGGVAKRTPTNMAKDCTNCVLIPRYAKTTLDRRKEIDELARASFQGKKISTEHVQNILISRASIKEYLNQPHKHFVEKNESLLQIDKLLQNAEYLGAHAPFKESAIKKGVLKEHILGVNIAGERSYLIVWEFEDGGKILHGISDSPNVLKTK